MKKIVLLAIILLSSGSLCNSQILKGYGLKLGLGITNQSWEMPGGKMEWDNNTGLTARAFADFLDLPVFNIETEISYSQKGFKGDLLTTTVENPDGIGQQTLINNRLSYLSFALLGKVKYEVGLFTPYLVFGPQYHFLAGTDVEKRWNVVFDNFNKSSWGYSLGAGTMVNILKISFLAEYRFERDFKHNDNHLLTDIKNYSHSIMVGLEL